MTSFRITDQLPLTVLTDQFPPKFGTMRGTFMSGVGRGQLTGRSLRRRTTMGNTELVRKLDAAIAEKNLLKHPFYQDWQAGKLSRETLQLYAAQYYRHVEAFPKHLRVLAARTEGPLQGLIRENLAEEENQAGPHPKLGREFAAAVGVGEDDITCRSEERRVGKECRDRGWP